MIMTAISPNGDGKNDSWYIEPFNDGAELKIVDRNGRTVYEALPYNNDFSGLGFEEGVYFYDLYFKEINKRYKGHFQIMK
jgi:gliding motility-associated-like protein